MIIVGEMKMLKQYNLGKCKRQYNLYIFHQFKHTCRLRVLINDFQQYPLHMYLLRYNKYEQQNSHKQV